MEETQTLWRWRPSPLQADFVLALVLTALLVYGAIGEAYPTAPDNSVVNGAPVPQPPAAAYVLVAVACLVLTWRRRWPLPVFAVSLAAVLAYAGLGYLYGAAVVAPMVALYTVASRTTLRRAVLLGAVTFATVAGAAAPGPFGPLFSSLTTVLALEIAAVVAVGIAVANRRDYIQAIQERAERAERTREEEARHRVDAERLRIARELHDVVAHTIATVNVQARVAAQVIDDPPPEGAQALTAIKESSAEAMRELRTILGLLRQDGETDPTTPAPGLGQLDALVASTVGAGVPTMVEVSGEPRQLSPSVDLAAYRIVQESLTNVLRHTEHAAATVSIHYDHDALVLRVDDTGQAPAVNGDDPADGGHGIIGMRERATAIGGDVTVGARPNGGFQVTARLPVR